MSTGTPDETPLTADYTDAGVPTFEHVREVIERRTAGALGAEELAQGTAAAQDTERRYLDHERAAQAKLAEIRRSLQQGDSSARPGPTAEAN